MMAVIVKGSRLVAVPANRRDPFALRSSDLSLPDQNNRVGITRPTRGYSQKVDTGRRLLTNPVSPVPLDAVPPGTDRPVDERYNMPAENIVNREPYM